LWLIVLSFLPIAACALLIVNAGSESARDATREEFQHLVGGLGFGPAVDLSSCSFSFDPRLCPDCQQDHGPILGGVYFCPHHACSILFYPPLTREAETSGEPGRHALFP
jgi:hypothetical protein